MENGKFLQTVLKMQNVPRWDEYAPKYKDNAANHSFRCAAYALIAALVEEKLFGNRVDKVKIVGRALFHDLNETITGSIKHNTKKDEFVQKHIKEIEQEASKTIVSYLSKSLRPHFEDFVVNAEDETYEGRIIDAIDTFDAMMFCAREAESGSEFFEKQFEKLHERLESYRDVPSVCWLLQEFDKKEEMYTFLNYILDMDKLKRWKAAFNLVEDNDASHSFRATALSAFNGYVEMFKYGKEINMFALLGKTLFHDLVEVKTGDAKGDIKHLNHKIKEAFKMYEKKMAETMIEHLPCFLKEEISNFMIDAKDDTYEGMLVDISDKLDALIKTNMEMKICPSEYKNLFYKLLERIQHTYGDVPCVLFFLAFPLHDIIRTTPRE